MAFGNTPLLTAFPQADENPVANGMVGPLFTGEDQLRVVSNQLTNNGSDGNSYWATPFSGNIEGWLQLTTALDVGERIIIYAAQTVGSSVSGYRIQWRNIAGDHVTIIDRCDSGGITQLGATIDPPENFGSSDKFGLEIKNGVIAAYWDDGAGWTLQDSRTDSTYTGPFYIGISIVGAGLSVDNLGGGATSSVTFKATGTASFSANSVTPAIPGGAADGDMMLLLSGGKPYNRGIGANPAGQGWTSLGTFTDGTTAAGVDTGSMAVQAWYKEHDGSESDPTITEDSPTFNVLGGFIMVFSKPSGSTWDAPVMVGGGDSSAGTGFSVTAGSDPGVADGDMVAAFAAFRSDAATPLAAPLSLSQTGVTFSGTTRSPSTDPETTTGGDMGMTAVYANAAGTSSAAPVISGTLPASHTGSAGFIRLRSTAPSGTDYDETPSDTITLSDAISLGLKIARADSLSLSDAVARAAVLAKADSIALSEAITKKPALAKADSVTLSDASVRKPTLGKADTLTLSDISVRAAGLRKSDTVSLSDAAGKAVGKPFADSLTLSDNIVTTILKLIQLSDTITMSDARVSTIGLGKADTVNLSDNLARAWDAVRSFADTTTLSDAISKAPGLVKADSISTSDAVGKSEALSRADAISLADTIAKQLGLSHADTVSLADAFDKALTRALSDTLTLSDSATPLLTPGGGPLTLHDVLTLTDDLAIALNGVYQGAGTELRTIILGRFGIY